MDEKGAEGGQERKIQTRATRFAGVLRWQNMPPKSKNRKDSVSLKNNKSSEKDQRSTHPGEQGRRRFRHEPVAVDDVLPSTRPPFAAITSNDFAARASEEEASLHTSSRDKYEACFRLRVVDFPQELNNGRAQPSS